MADQNQIEVKVTNPKITSIKLITDATTGLFMDKSVRNIKFKG